MYSTMDKQSSSSNNLKMTTTSATGNTETEQGNNKLNEEKNYIYIYFSIFIN